MSTYRFNCTVKGEVWVRYILRIEPKLGPPLESTRPYKFTKYESFKFELKQFCRSLIGK